jgi:hypothetical protein
MDQQDFENDHADRRPDRRAQQRHFQVAPEYRAAHPRTGTWIVNRGLNGIDAGISRRGAIGYNCS